MDSEEAAALIEQALAKFREQTYADLVRRITTEPRAYQLTGPSGTTYQIEVQFFWDNRPGGDVRVLGSIDDSGWRAFVPLNRDFIKAQDRA